jgi:hypothetical protein
VPCAGGAAGDPAGAGERAGSTSAVGAAKPRSVCFNAGPAFLGVAATGAAGVGAGAAGATGAANGLCMPIIVPPRVGTGPGWTGAGPGAVPSPGGGAMPTIVCFRPPAFFG